MNSVLQHPTSKRLIALSIGVIGLLVIVEVIGVLEYGQPPEGALANVLIAIACLVAGAFAGLAFRRRRVFLGTVGVGMVIGIDVGSTLVLPFREQSFLFAIFSPELLVIALGAGIYGWWWQSRRNADEEK